MIKPQSLKPGDSIALVAPARAVQPEEVEGFKSWAQHFGWKVLESPNLYGRDNQFSGSHEQRASDLHWAAQNPEVKAVMSARGGYGCMPLLPLLQPELFLNNPKWWCGYSDLTTLHLWLQKQGLASLHSPMATRGLWENHAPTDDGVALARALQGEGIEIELFSGQPFEGELVGGNLSLVYASLGTPEQPDTTGKVLFLEDLDEYLYHIDRMGQSMQRAGLFQEPAAVLFGSLIDMNDNAVPFGRSAQQIMRDLLKTSPYPQQFDIPVGHAIPNRTIALGLRCTFDGLTLRQDT